SSEDSNRGRRAIPWRSRAADDRFSPCIGGGARLSSFSRGFVPKHLGEDSRNFGLVDSASAPHDVLFGTERGRQSPEWKTLSSSSARVQDLGNAVVGPRPH